MVFDFNNHTMLAEQIIKLIENQALRENISKELVSLIKTRFSAYTINKEIVEFYKRVNKE